MCNRGQRHEQFTKGSPYTIWNTATGNKVEDVDTAIGAVLVVNTLNDWAVNRCGKEPRCIVVDNATGEKVILAGDKYKV
jgi:hypothetical protein